MILLFARHGKAEERKPGQSDEERRLTEEGRKGVEAVARLLPVTPSIIYVSPLRRAVETGEIFARILGVEMKIVDELRPEVCSFDSLRRYVADRVMFVGHAPSIENVVSELVGGRIKLKSGAVAIVELEKYERGTGVLTALITPDVATRAGR